MAYARRRTVLVARPIIVAFFIYNEIKSQKELMIKIHTEYLQDTWRFSRNAPYWSIGDINKYATMNSRERYMELLMQTFKSFEGLIFPLKVILVPHYEETGGGVTNIETSSQSMPMILTSVQEAITNFEGDIYEIQVDVAVQVYCRLKKQEGIKRVWLNLKDEFVISAGKDDPKPSISFALSHLLFNPDISDKRTNNLMLYNKNHPLLEQALRKWEQNLGPINEWSNYGPVFQYGVLED
jgi:hypothetical protein